MQRKYPTHIYTYVTHACTTGGEKSSQLSLSLRVWRRRAESTNVRMNLGFHGGVRRQQEGDVGGGCGKKEIKTTGRVAGVSHAWDMSGTRRRHGKREPTKTHPRARRWLWPPMETPQYSGSHRIGNSHAILEAQPCWRSHWGSTVGEVGFQLTWLRQRHGWREEPSTGLGWAAKEADATHQNEIEFHVGRWCSGSGICLVAHRPLV